MAKNSTKTGGGLIIFSIAWKPALYRKIQQEAKKNKISKAEVVKSIVTNYFEEEIFSIPPYGKD